MSSKRACLYVNINAIISNLAYVKKCVGKDCNLLYVAKADCYGLGAEIITPRIEELDYVYGFATVSIEEAIKLRAVGIKKPILMLSKSFPEDMEDIIAFDIMPTVYTLQTASSFSKIASKIGKEVKVHIKIDSGMNRTGFYPNDESLEEIREIFSLKNIRPVGIYTHFSKADEKDKSYTDKQYASFIGFVNRLREAGMEFDYVHCQNSAASTYLQTEGCNLARPGIICYGIDPMEGGENKNYLKDVVEYKASVIFVKKVPKGSIISYGGTFETKRDSVIATVSAGYADGVPRSLSNKGEVIIKGQRAPIVGRICMDQFMIDVTEIEGVETFDEVTIIGRDGNEKISIEEVAQISGRFSYELLCDMGSRVFREYI